MRSKQKYSPGVMSLLPLFYVGWADRVLSPTELKLITQKLKEFPFLNDEDQALLSQWSDPSRVPSNALFKHWVHLIRETSAQLPPDSRKSLADLGIEMAKKSAGDEDKIIWNTPETKSAIRELESILGISAPKQYRNIFPTTPQTKELEELPAQSSFELAAMTRLLDGDYHEIRNRMRILLSDPAFRYITLRNKSDYRDQVLGWCKLLANQGFGALAYPEAFGGKNDMGAYISIFEMLGFHDLSLAIKFGVQFGLFGGSVFWLGTQRHHDRHLQDIGTLDLAGCFAMTETAHGSNVRGLETTITYLEEMGQFEVHTPREEAGKEYIGNAMHSRMASVFGQLIVKGENKGIHCILVPLRDQDHRLLPGIRVEDNGYKLGLNGVDNGRIWFHKVRVPRENLLNRFGDVDQNGNYSSTIENPSRRFFTMLGTLVGGRVSVPKAGLSAAKSGLSIAIKYALKRRQFAPSETDPETLLLDYPSHQRRLMPLLAKTYALDFALNYLAKRYIQRTEEDIREIETLAAALKSYASWFTTEVLQESREACGGKGYLAENRLADLKADTEIFTTFEGDNTVLMQLVAKGLLSSFKKEFHDEGFWAVMRFVSRQVSTSITQLNPIVIRNTDVEHLLDPQFHLSAFQYRERKLLVSVSQRMRNLLSRRVGPYDAFLRCQTHLLELSMAYAERLVLEQFGEALNSVDDNNLKAVLKKLYELFALHTIEQNKGWYLESGYMEGNKTKAIRRLVDRLCKDVRMEAGPLVQAFAIPDSCLAAPIAL